MRKILIIFGTRPEAIKLAPIIIKLRNEDWCQLTICNTGQHKELVDEVLKLFKITPDIDLSLMKKKQSLASLSSRLFEKLESVFLEATPEIAIVHGDTTTAMVGSLMSYYNKVKICHVEAGLRTKDKWQPFPEEINRQTIARVTDLHCAPTKSAKSNLLTEGIGEHKIIVTGNTIVDSLEIMKAISEDSFPLQQNSEQKIILVTIHRRENQGESLSRILTALKKIATTRTDVKIILPLHPNPAVAVPITQALKEIDRIQLIPALKYDEFINLMSQCHLIITDSGGIQEEAPSFGKPVIVLRSETERKESLQNNSSVLVGDNTELIVSSCLQFLDDTEFYEQHIPEENPYGDGKASERIIDKLKSL